MKSNQKALLVVLATTFFLSSAAWSGEAASTGGTRFAVGHFTFSVPKGWNSFSATDKAEARRGFASDLAPGLNQYAKPGALNPRMGDFEILQKQPDGQLIGWTLIVPDQTDFLKEILKREDVEFQKRKDLAGGGIKGGFCRLVKIGDMDVVRVDVEMVNGGKSTNLQFWSAKRPGLVTTIMLGLRANKSEQTQKDFEAIISSIKINESPKD